MKYGFILPSGDARTAADLAVVAEDHGWDGFFVWEPIWGIDPWVSLAAAAVRTQRIRLGTMLTPVPRREPWKLASETTTLQNLSQGRLILAVGLGVAGEDRWWLFEDDPGRRVRAERLDEGLEMLTHLWRGEPFSYDGKHYRTVRRPDRLMPPPPAVEEKIPVWVVGAWPRPKSMRRAARWDGFLPNYLPDDRDGHQAVTPEVLSDAVAWIRAERANAGLSMDSYDVVVEGTTPAEDPDTALATVRSWADIGATWWLEADWSNIDRADALVAAEARLKAGPPRISA